jgi:transglutaminase-like putative cysteine protease
MDEPLQGNSTRRYRVSHQTEYDYSSESALCHNQLHLRPRELPLQRVSHSLIEIDPKPACRFQWDDTFGNHVEFFSIEELHASLTVTSKCVVERALSTTPMRSGLDWDEWLAWIHRSTHLENIAAKEFLYDSRYCHRGAEFRDYAAPQLVNARDAIEALLTLNTRIHTEFSYDPESTHVTTHPLDVLAKKRGVCQDFAHVLICCLRSLGVPARYVSGYLLTQPPPGKPRLVGADASHAWVSAYVGPLGWIDLDPTNNAVLGSEHITVAWGRDYADVAPIQGVYVGGGFTTLNVAVDVTLANDSLME